MAQSLLVHRPQLYLIQVFFLKHLQGLAKNEKKLFPATLFFLSFKELQETKARAVQNINLLI